MNVRLGKSKTCVDEIADAGEDEDLQRNGRDLPSVIFILKWNALRSIVEYGISVLTVEGLRSYAK